MTDKSFSLKKYKSFLEKGIFYSLIFISITFPLPYKVSNIGIVFLIFFWLAEKLLIKKIQLNTSSLIAKAIFFCFIVLFLMQLLSLLYTDNISLGIKNIESKLSFLVIPIILFDIKIAQKKLIKLIKYFVYSLSICTICLLLNSFLYYFFYGTLLTYHEFVEPLHFHAIFYSYYVFLSILICIYLFSEEKLNQIEKTILIVSLLLFFSGLIISASKNVLLVTILFLVIGFIYKTIRHRVKPKELAIIVLILIAATIAITNTPSINNRLKEVTELRGMNNYHKVKRGEILNNDDVQLFNGTSLRILLWDMGINRLIEDNKLLYGLSPGDRRDIMNEELDKCGLLYYYKNYNLHNQFVQIFVELGLIGLLVYLSLHILIIIEAVKQNNMLLLAFITGLIFFQITESVIERNKGIVFYCFFITLLLSLKSKNENRDSRY